MPKKCYNNDTHEPNIFTRPFHGGRVEDLEGRLADLEDRFVDLEDRFDDLDGRLKEQNTRMGDLHRAVKQGNEDLLRRIEAMLAAKPAPAPAPAKPEPAPAPAPAPAKPEPAPAPASAPAKPEPAPAPVGLRVVRAYRYWDAQHRCWIPCTDIWRAKQASGGVYDPVWSWVDGQGRFVRTLNNEELDRYAP